MLKVKRNQITVILFLCAGALLLASCTSNIPSFNTQEIQVGSTTLITTLQTADAGDYESNNDQSSTCVGANTAILPAGGRGCMQRPELLYSDSRWFLGFSQNYLSTLPISRFSMFASLSSLSTGLFGGLGSGLGILDTGRAFNAAVAVPVSSRYLKFAKFPNGNVVGVYFIEESGARTVYASIYDATLDLWGAPTRLGTATIPTDFGADYTIGGQNVRTFFCRPSVATSGDGTAMATWCEDTGGAAARSELKYSHYSGGVWTTANLINAATAVSAVDGRLNLPGFHADARSFAAALVTGDEVAASVTLAAVTYTTTVTATTSTPTTAQFRLVLDSSGTAKMCTTLRNMADALLSTETDNDSTLGQLGVSIVLDPTCDDATAATWNVTTIYNKALTNIVRDTTAATANYSLVNPMQLNGANLTTYGATNPFTNNFDWKRTAFADIAGDVAGNYALVRSVAAPYFTEDATTTNSITSAGVGYARKLIGHQFIAGSGWKTVNNNLFTQSVSMHPACYNGSLYSSCSARGAKLHMTDAGKGIALYYQNQLFPLPYATATTFPTRLWYSTYSTLSGFASTPQTVDGDTYCSAASSANDTSVCETGSFDTANTVCQNLADGATTDVAAVIQNTTGITHDLAPIASAMNSSGKAIIAYNKASNTGSIAEPYCPIVNTYIVLYSPEHGMGDPIKMDDGLGNTMHAAVGISEAGDMAVAWEERIDGHTYVMVRYKRHDGDWSGVLDASQSVSVSSAAFSMMPTVQINTHREVVVSFTALVNGSSTRRQYVRKIQI